MNVHYTIYSTSLHAVSDSISHIAGEPDYVSNVGNRVRHRMQ